MAIAASSRLSSLLYVVGDDVGDDHARLVQHHVTERDAVGQRRPVRCSARRATGSAPGRASDDSSPGCDHLGEHHRRGLQRLFFFLGIGTARAVLHHQHAERVAGAQDRHAEERMVDFFAGFRPVREGRVALRVRQVDRVGLAGDQTDQTLVGFAARSGGRLRA